MPVSYLKKATSRFLNMRALKKHHSKMGWRDAPRYTSYLRSCQKAFVGDLPEPQIYGKLAGEFNKEASVSVWDENLEAVANQMFKRICDWEEQGQDLWLVPDGPLLGSHQGYVGDVWKDFPELEEAFRGSFGSLLMNIYKANYKIFYASLVKSVGTELNATGSQQWHSDGGPGSCVIIAMYLHPTDETSGCLQTLPWNASLEIFGQEHGRDAIVKSRYAAENNVRIADIDKLTLRNLRHKYYDDLIQENFRDQIRMPFGKAGSSVLFRNNTLHRGGHPELGKQRYALLIHCYPAEVAPPFHKYREQGLKKTAGYPADPGF
ncbi:hypothetical protein MACH10_30820 [Thalassospira tepidiphila]|uniref:hypothetical protein n=1 Tax=Thalassospira tepidiphila TaxID=393657 RepID=UPI002921A523|nr:hypothetical protein MACH10_30820 [Thalassospira tepidiphila]